MFQVTNWFWIIGYGLDDFYVYSSVINPFVYDLETQYANIRPGSSLGFNGYCSRKYKKQ
ncbi:hypothetical protein [Sphingobacterium multivorum]|uniref:hypothetical protein n=1 Tax=Sphingobacterium multivorum TaxID=28454 RepID=UPI0028A9FFB5|nr:hypothetical protein [Sphingobacterium multivorum]